MMHGHGVVKNILGTALGPDAHQIYHKSRLHSAAGISGKNTVSPPPGYGSKLTTPKKTDID